MEDSMKKTQIREALRSRLQMRNLPMKALPRNRLPMKRLPTIRILQRRQTKRAILTRRIPKKKSRPSLRKLKALPESSLHPETERPGQLRARFTI